ncbi:hypothetical protein SRHO_G00096500 [Serrasalmus rhombeus]
MKTFSLFLLTIVAVTAAPPTPSPSDEQRVQRVILKEIMQSVKYLNASLNNTVKKIFVQEAITTRHCTLENFCKAGKALEKLKAEDLGLPEKDWLLPRSLVAYTRNIQCKYPESQRRAELQDILHHIKNCAQMTYAKPF